VGVKNRVANLSSKLILAGSSLVTLIVTPTISYEPFNTPKFLISTVLAFSLLILLLTSINLKSFLKTNLIFSSLLLIFIIQSLLVLFSSKNLLTLQLFGIDGRNTGLILYFNLLVLLLVTSIVSNRGFIKNLINTLILVGLLNLLYGVIQFIGWDPVNWNNSYNPIIGFFGNPNFQSAFLGIVGASSFALFFKSKATLLYQSMLFSFLLLNLFIIVTSESQQGILVFISGFLISSYIMLLKSKKFFRISKYYGFSIVLAAAVVVLDIFQKLPWGSVLYKPSVSNRGDLWRAAWRMASDNPVTGVGFDSYEYFYRTYRDEVAIITRGASTTSNSAHNVFLDILSSGGFMLLAVYFGILLLVLLSAIKVLKREVEYNVYFVALFAAWIAYQIQSIISINQIGLAVWGWVLSGAIIGYERQTSRVIELEVVKNIKSSVTIYTKVAAGAAIGIIIGIIPLNSDTAFRAALDSKQINLVQESAYKWPQSPQKMFQVAALFRQNSLFPLSAQVAKDAVVKFPRSYENWELLSTLEGISDLEKKGALNKMKELDPLNSNIK
jgi:O-antigen ligase